MDSPPPELPTPISIRSDLIATAVNFLKDPQVKAAPLSKRLAFLESKGLTAEEIDLALIKSNDQLKSDEGQKEENRSKNNNFIPNNPQVQAQTTQFSYKGLIITTAVILGTGSLILSNYDTIKSFAKKLFRSENDDIKRVESELRQSIKELKDLIEEKEKLLQEALKSKVSD